MYHPPAAQTLLGCESRAPDGGAGAYKAPQYIQQLHAGLPRDAGSVDAESIHSLTK